MLNVFPLLPKQLTKWIIQGQGLLRNPYTLGVRVIVEDDTGAILLIRHTYLNDWYLPGGGVDTGESLHQAAVRELQEEAGIALISEPELVNVYLNRGALGRDHVGLFKAGRWEPTGTFLKPNREIADAAFFPLDGLPASTSEATVRRLLEHQNAAFPAGGVW
ncbi:NUDIX domain-containing protein [Roseibium denhamense]|nr:NUDIX domain-containing protein [Roseibium denhamense]MTI06354.1 NUDIX domain-containing protein [Roseibium denhamense]